MPQRRPNPMLWLLTPLIWLERTRGRWRLALLVLYLIVGGVSATLLWRGTSLWSLPDVGDPFDVAAFGKVEIAEDQNAFTFYRWAVERLKPLSLKEHQQLSAASRGRNFALTWGTALPAEKEELARNGEAMALWLRGSECSDGAEFPPGAIRIDSVLTTSQALRTFSRLALLEASRREQEGDMAGAWRYYRADLRTSRHLGMHGGIIQRLIGKAILSMAAGPAETWAADSRVDVATLRQAVRDVATLQSMTARNSVMLKVEYVSLLHAIDGSTDLGNYYDTSIWYTHLPAYWQTRNFLMREPERARRVLRLAFANWLSECDTPQAIRPRLVGRDPELYPAAPGSITLPQPELEAWALTSAMARTLQPAIAPAVSIGGDRDQATVSGLQIDLAQRLYAREHGRPPKTVGELIGPDMPTLPVGCATTDLVGPPLLINPPATPASPPTPVP